MLLKTYTNVWISCFVGMSLVWCLCSGCQPNNKSKDAVEASQVKPLEKQTILDRPTVNIKPNQIIQSPLDIQVNSEGEWGGFEGELGTVELFDTQSTRLGLCVLSTTENWMVKGPVHYNCILEFDDSSTSTGKLVFRNNNPTGMVEHDKSFEIPIGLMITK